MAIAKALQEGIETTLATFVTGKSAAVASALVPVALVGLTLYVLLLGYAVARGEVNDSVGTLGGKFIKIALIVTISLAGGSYQALVMEGINGIEGFFTTALGGVANVGELIDASLGTLEDVTGQLFTAAMEPMFPEMRLVLAAVLCAIGQVLITAAALIPLLIAKVTLGILLAIGPAFVMCALWPATARFTEAWLSTTLAAVMTVVVVAAVVGFLPLYIKHYADQVLANLGTANSLQDVIGLFIVILVLVWLAWKSSELGAQVIGGGSLGNPASTIVQSVLNRFAFARLGNGSGGSGKTSGGSTNTISAGRGGSGTPLAQHQVISQLNRNAR